MRAPLAVGSEREDAPGEARLIAYLVPGAGPLPSPTEMRRALAARLPDFMVPSATPVTGSSPAIGSRYLPGQRLRPVQQHADDNFLRICRRTAGEAR